MKTIDTIRDELAELTGYTKAADPTKYTFEDVTVWLNPHGMPVMDVDWGIYDHPIPNDLDGIAAMIPDGLAIVVEKFLNGNGDWVWAARARKGPTCVGAVTDADTEYEARTRLLHAVLTATKGATHEK